MANGTAGASKNAGAAVALTDVVVSFRVAVGTYINYMLRDGARR